MINDIIKQMRIASGLSQMAYAKEIGVSQSTLSGYETGYSVPNYKIVEKMAEISDFGIVFIDRATEEMFTANPPDASSGE